MVSHSYRSQSETRVPNFYSQNHDKLVVWGRDLMSIRSV